MSRFTHAHAKTIQIEGSAVMPKRTCRHCAADLTFVTYRDTIEGFGCFPCELARDPEFRRRIVADPYVRD